MKKLGILLAVFIMCLLCTRTVQGYILVYDTIRSGVSAEFETDVQSGWLLKVESGHGYLVLDVNDSDANVLNDAKYIDYHTETNPSGARVKVYYILDNNGTSQTILPGYPPRGKKIVDVESCFSNSMTASGRLLGTASKTDIGLSKKKDVATNLNGVGEADDPNDIGYLMFSLTLNSKWTKSANSPSPGFNEDLDSLLGGLIGWLESRGYTPQTE